MIESWRRRYNAVRPHASSSTGDPNPSSLRDFLRPAEAKGKPKPVG